MTLFQTLAMNAYAPTASVSGKLRFLAPSLAAENSIVIDEYGAARVGSSRVLLEMVLWSYKRGDAAERIVEKYPTLEPSDVRAVIAYYLRNREPLDEFLQELEAIGKTAQDEAAALNAGKIPTKKDLRARVEAALR